MEQSHVNLNVALWNEQLVGAPHVGIVRSARSPPVAAHELHNLSRNDRIFELRGSVFKLVFSEHFGCLVGLRVVCDTKKPRASSRDRQARRQAHSG